MVGSCEHGDEPSVFKKVKDCLDQLTDCEILKNHLAHGIYLLEKNTNINNEPKIRRMGRKLGEMTWRSVNAVKLEIGG